MNKEQEKGQDGVCAVMLVRFKDGGHEANINEHDFDPKKHEKVEAEEKPAEKKAEKKSEKK